jgi:hypothetical protein
MSVFEGRERTVIRVCMSFLSLLVSNSSERSTPQKFFCGSSDSIPACCSSGPSCRIHWTRKSAFDDPRRKLMIIPGSKCVRTAPSRAPVGVMSIVCAKCVTLSIETLTGNTIFLRGAMRLFSIGRHSFPLLLFSSTRPISILAASDSNRGSASSFLAPITGIVCADTSPWLRHCPPLFPG